ncbi:hypothetical protein, variant [Aphanomyces invadans]|uniref:CENP-V/GFA domain-containing protein n=1 Tax=Aphanomyces invadans TaxID=157072 RepID=A0A024TIT1_9STRA|nr:hypothetical protein, variant [Aphanomyces invadans]ETV94075.1 hypothetical protein, variant [Aphanomyces invadans]|eukprot:XP_008877277.1 hypothetical protein, variant [Aphanomyces invadans]
MGSTRLPGVDRLIGSLATIGVGVAIYLAHQFLKPKEMTLDEYYRQKYVDPSTLVGHKGSCGCGNLTFIVLAPRSLCAFDDSNTFPSKLGRIPVFLAPMTHLQMTSNHSATDVAVYSHQASATYATQHVFCKQCGIHLFHMELHRNDQVAINVYTLETDYIEDLRVEFPQLWCWSPTRPIRRWCLCPRAHIPCSSACRRRPSLMGKHSLLWQKDRPNSVRQRCNKATKMLQNLKNS